jgi:integrase/recombinase XerD
MGGQMSQQISAKVPTSKVPTPEKLLNLFIEDCHLRALTDETIRRYSSIVNQFLKFIEETSIGVTLVDVGKQVLQDYIRLRRSNGIDQKTLENEMSGISSFYGFLAFQDYIGKNPVSEVRKRYLTPYKKETAGDVESPRKLISVEQMSMLINSIIDTRDKAILTLLAKTGLRRGELISLNITDINWTEQSITLQKNQFKKRSGRTVFFDDETSRVVRHWLRQREGLQPQTPALFVGEKGDRLKRNGVYSTVVKYAERVGLHDSHSSNPEAHFTPHCFRHFFTTHLRRAGMDREFIKILRGDRRREAIDIYDRIDREELRRSYLAFIPQLGI